MEDQNIYEYVVSPAKQPIWKLKRLLAIIGYVVYAAAFFIIGMTLRIIVPMMALIPLTTWILVWFTWPFVSVEYEYSIVSGSMILCKICGGRIRRRKAEIRIKTMHAIAPYDGAYIQAAQDYAPEVTLDFTSTLQSPDVYYALYETENGRRGILYFEATARALKLLRYYNSATVVTAVRY